MPADYQSQPFAESPFPSAPSTPSAEYPIPEKYTPPRPKLINPRLVHYLGTLPPFTPSTPSTSPATAETRSAAAPANDSTPLREAPSPLTPATPEYPTPSEYPTELPPAPEAEAEGKESRASQSNSGSSDSSEKSSPPPQAQPSTLPADDVAAVDQLGKKFQALKSELAKVIIGQEQVIEQLAICLFARGHGLLMGVPGLAKTLLVSSIAETMDLGFNRIQFTPDLMPADISGTDIIQESDTGRREFQFVKGPIFSNIVLADEINRAPAKTQSAMLEAMQERSVTVLGRTYQLDAPFFVLATQNPVEQEGTYPLPEAQLDRFMFLIEVDYPSAEEEKRIARETTGVDKARLQALLSGEEVIQFQSLVRRVPVPDHIYDYAVEIVRRTRPDTEDAPEWIKEYVGWGAGPRAVQYLILGCKARAALRGTYMASLEDIEAVAGPVLGHRVLTNFAAESQGMTSKKIVARLVEEMRDDA